MLNGFSDRVPEQRRGARPRISGILGGCAFSPALFAAMAAGEWRAGPERASRLLKA